MTSKKANKLSPEVPARMVLGWFWITPASIRRAGGGTSIAAKIGCTPETLHDWVKKAEVDNRQRPALREAEGAATREPRA
ncbi:hypothetical protein [Bradyrhizobium yuanmingense]|uniref:hypothetical protein n=1 Tax=Bradyrhizobium yuanmingense TaxID=108015 RepID=UPI003B978A36